MIIDAHAHVWTHWPHSDPVPAYGIGIADLLTEMDSCGVRTALLVGAALPGAARNNEHVAGALAAHEGRLLQFVDADSRWSRHYHAPGAARRLRQLIARHRPIGVSHYLGADDDGWLASVEAQSFFAVAAEHGLLVSLSAPAAWHPAVCRMAREFPGVPILLNHLGGVGFAPDAAAATLELIGAGQSLPNLLVKVSGLYYGAVALAPPYPEQMSLVRTFYETWGPERLVWGSDFPSCRAHLCYRQTLEFLTEYADFLSDAERAAVLGGNLRRTLATTTLAHNA